MRAILHFGMPKTGSSSIQDSFFAAKVDNFRYFDWRAANHSSLLAGIVRDETSPFIQKLPEEQIRQMVAEWQAKFEAGIAARPVDNVIFSAERLYRSSPAKKQRLKDFFDQYCDSYLVIGYVREPVSFLQSGFQQNVKTGLDTLRIKQAWPRFRKHIGELDAVFGAENVQVRPFDRAHLHNGDVVQDFAHAIGADLDPADIRTANESLSLESLALLFAERVHGQGVDKMDRASLHSNRRLVARLSGVKGRKLAFDPAMMQALYEENREDLAWIEQRMGQAFAPPPQATGPVIARPRDLHQVALEAQPLLDAQIRAAAAEHRDQTPQEIAAILDAFIADPRKTPKPAGQA